MGIKTVIEKRGVIEELVNSDGSLTVKLPSVFSGSSDFANNDLSNVGLINGIDLTTISGSAIPANVIIVAKSGGQYTTVAAGLAAASSGDSVVVYPGTYSENVTIPSGVRLLGYPAAQAVIVNGADTSSTRVTMDNPSTLREITIVGPSTGSNPAVDCSGLGAGELAVLFNLAMQGGGAGHTGPLIKGAGSGLVAGITGIYHNGGITSGPFCEVSGGVVFGDNWIANAGQASDFVKVVEGEYRVEGLQVSDNSLYSCTDLFEIVSGTLDVQSVETSVTAPAATNGLHISGDGCTFDGIGAMILGSTYDVLVDPGLVGSGTIFHANGCEFRYEKLSFPSSFAENADIITSFVDSGVSNDGAYRVVGGELDVGSPEVPTESSFGEGDSTISGMTVLSDDGTGASFVDNTAAAKTKAGSTFSLWQSPASGSIAYFGNASRQFNGFKVDGGGTAVSLNTGSLVWEYWGGSSWDTFNIMASQADFPYAQKAQDAFDITNTDEQIRFNMPAMTGSWATSTLNTTSSYWVRCKISSSIETVPVIERIKLGTNRTEINKDGIVEFFGRAEPKRTFWEGNGENLSAPTGGANSPANLDVTISSNITYRQQNSLYAAGSDSRRAGTIIEIPDEIDTSRPVTFKMLWKLDGTDTGGVRWDLYTANVAINTAIGSLPEVNHSKTIAGPGVAEQTINTEFEIDVSNLKPGDALAFMLWRLGATDANTDDAGILAIQLEGTFWEG